MQIIENNAKACLSMQRCNMKVAAFHNSREGFVPESSRPELAKKNRCSCSALAALQKIQKWDQKADENYAKTHGGRKSPVKEQNKVWEAVINLNDRHTLKDVKKLTKKLEKITGYKAAQIAIHKDEGHLDEESGNFVLNIHAHVIFYARDVKTGLSLSAANYARKDLMRQMQDAVADELCMERGRPAEETGRKHLSPRAFKAQKRQEAAINANNKEWEQKLEKTSKEWEAKLEANNKAWQEKQAAWEQKQAEREARREEWERKIPEIIAARERRSKFISDKLDWESARDGKKLAYEMEMLGISFAGVNNPNGNILLEAQKDAIRNIFYMLGTTAQLAVFLMNKTLANDEKLAADAKIFNVESTLLRAVDYVANSDPDNAEELKKRIQRTFLGIPEDKRRELFQYAIENAPTPELKNDIRALIEGRFSDIAKSEQAQKRIENRDLRAELREYAEEVRKIRDELKAMDEENRILNLAERAILKQKGAQREEYAEQESQNRERLNELSELKQQAKDLNNAIRDQKQSPDKDAKTVAEQADKIKELTDKIAQITAENAEKQRELEQELEQEKAKRLIAPQQLDKAERRISELEDKIREQEFIFYGKADEIEAAEFEKEIIAPQTLDPFSIIDELEPEQKQPEPVKPEPEPIKKDDFTNIYGYPRPNVEPRRRLDDYEPRRPREDDRPKYEPEPIREPEKPREEPIFRDPWQEITDSMEKWKKTNNEVEKNLLKTDILEIIEKYEKNGVPPHRRMSLDSYIQALRPNPAADAEALRKMRELELEKKRRAAELEKKYDDDVKKSVKQDTDARQHNIKKKKDELEMGMS